MATPQPECAAREVSLNAVRADAMQLAETLTGIDETLTRLADHLNGNPNRTGELGGPIVGGGIAGADAAAPGLLPMLCDQGSRNINKAQTIQEKRNQICYQRGEGM